MARIAPAPAALPPPPPQPAPPALEHPPAGLPMPPRPPHRAAALALPPVPVSALREPAPSHSAPTGVSVPPPPDRARRRRPPRRARRARVEERRLRRQLHPHPGARDDGGFAVGAAREQDPRAVQQARSLQRDRRRKPRRVPLCRCEICVALVPRPLPR